MFGSFGQAKKALLLTLCLLAVTQAAAIGHRSASHDRPGHIHDDSARHEALHALEEHRASNEQLALLGLRRDEARCGKKMYVLANTPVGAPAACTHGPDTFAATPTVEGTYKVDTPPGIPCYTTAGKRVKVIYAYKDGSPNLINKRGPLIREAVAITDRAFAGSAKRSGSSVQHVRWLMTSTCKLKIHVYKVPTTYANTGGLAKWLRDTGKLTKSQKALTFQDWTLDPSYTCSGLGEMWPDESKSKTVNENNRQQYGGMMTWVDTPGCLPNISYTYQGGALVAAHELMHTLGAVQHGAPNADGGGHCTDEWDIMCYGWGTTTVCGGGEGLQGDRLFDCKHNDYYDPTPKTGSYLANKWNTARSDWLTTATPAKWDRLHRPKVQILAPSGGGTMNIPATLKAKANGGAKKVTFLVNGRSVATDSTGTSLGSGWYEFSVNLSTAKARSVGLANGKTVPVQAKAVDSIGRPGSAKVSVTVTAPTVSLGDPVGDEWGDVSGITSWSATAAAPTGRTIGKVELLVNGAVLATDTSAPFGGVLTFPEDLWWSTANVVARATDSAGSQMQTANRWLNVREPSFEYDAPGDAQVGVPYRGWVGGEASVALAKVQLARVTYDPTTYEEIYTVVAEDTTAPFVPSYTVPASAETDGGTFGLIGVDGNGAVLFRQSVSTSLFGADTNGPTATVTSPADLATVVEGSVPLVVAVDLGRFTDPVCTATVTTNCTTVTAYVSSSLGWADDLAYHEASGTWRGTLDTTGGGQRGGFISVRAFVSGGPGDYADAVTSGPLVFLP